MLYTLILYFFLLGLIIGSFLNVVILRYNTGKTIGGRSACMSCKTILTWRELIPLFSFVFQKGACKTCKSKLDWQYPLVELSTGVLFAGNFLLWVHNASSIIELAFTVALTTIILVLMIIIFVYDVRHKIIPDVFSFSAWGFAILFILGNAFVGVIPAKAGIQFDSWIPAFAGMTNLSAGMTNLSVGMTSISFVAQHIFAGLFFYAVIWLIWKISHGRAIGLGDAKLLLSIGTILGFVYGLSALFISVWIATMYALYILLKQQLSKRGKHITMKTEIPFGPFLIIGFLIVYFFHIDVTNLTIVLENFS